VLSAIFDRRRRYVVLDDMALAAQAKLRRVLEHGTSEPVGSDTSVELGDAACAALSQARWAGGRALSSVWSGSGAGAPKRQL
jgi:hypothetical protein